MSTPNASLADVGLRARIGSFFYGEEVPYGLAIVRILMSFSLFLAMVIRWPHARELYSTDGAPTPIWMMYNYPNFLPEPSGAVAVVIESVLLLALIASCLGWCTRLSLVLATAGYFYLNALDSVSTMTKYSVIALHVMFLLCFSQCGTIWSVDNWLRRSRLRARGLPSYLANRPRQFSAAPRRLMQLLIALVYLGAAATKLHTPAFFTGEQLQTWMITEYNYPNMFGNHLAMHLPLLVACAYLSIAWEILFIFLVWRRIGRLIMLAMGVGFHVMTWLALGLYLFPVICISAYFAFFDASDVEHLRNLFTRWRVQGGAFRAALGRALGTPIRSLPPAMSAGSCYALFAILIVATITGGLAAEYKLDPYAIRRPEGPRPLKELDPAYVAEVTGPTKRIRTEDKVFAFDVGTILAAGAVLDRRTQFRQGEKIQVQCVLTTPHEDMWVECNLRDSENRTVDTVDLPVAVDAMRALFYYNIGDCLMPGSYYLALKISGEEVMRREITILPRIKSASAN
jgi:hypothetical protein